MKNPIEQICLSVAYELAAEDNLPESEVLELASRLVREVIREFCDV